MQAALRALLEKWQDVAEEVAVAAVDIEAVVAAVVAAPAVVAAVAAAADSRVVAAAVAVAMSEFVEPGVLVSEEMATVGSS